MNQLSLTYTHIRGATFQLYKKKISKQSYFVVFCKTRYKISAMIKSKRARLKKQIDNFLFDHYIFKTVLDYLGGFFVALISAAIFAFGFSSFVTTYYEGGFTIATGGVSGIAQIIALIVEFIVGHPIGKNLIQSIGYTLLNVPLLIFSFLKIGKRFSIMTLINVLLTSLFISLFSNSGISKSVAEFSYLAADGVTKVQVLEPVIVRVLFAGICTGLSSAFAFIGGISCGGIDIVSYYLGARKSTQVGRYNILINAVIVVTYSFLKCFNNDVGVIYSLYSIIFSIIYLMECGLIVDAINLRNKKVEVQIITSKVHMPEIIIANFPHSATVVNGRGAYSGAEKIILWVAISTNEVKRIVDVAKKVDEHVFIAVTPLKQVYGNFFIKPLE